MANIKLLLRKKKGQEITDYPIVLRFTKNRRVKFQYLGHTSTVDDWDAKAQQVKPSHPLYKSLKVLLANKKAEAESTLLDLENKQPVFSLEQLKQKIKRGNSSITFLKYADKYVQDIFDRGKINVAKSEKSRVKGVRDFLKGRDVDFFEVDVALINKLKTYLLTKGKSEKTVNNYLILIRTIYNRAISEGLIEREYYPFGGRDKIQLKQMQGKKIGLEADELQSIRDLKLEKQSALWHVRNVFLLSYNFAGVRISDLLILRWTDVQNNRLAYTMGKTSAQVSIPIADEARVILNYYKKEKRTPDDFVLPYVKEADWDSPEDVQRKINSAISNFNKRLKRIADRAEIEKKLSNHIARHTFGNISGDKIPLPILQKLYRHQSLNTTAIYQGNFMHKDTDEALLKVLNPQKPALKKTTGKKKAGKRK